MAETQNPNLLPDSRSTAQIDTLNRKARVRSARSRPEPGKLSDRVGSAKESGSRQAHLYDEQFANREGTFLAPPFPFNELGILMETCSTHYACVKAKAAAISGVGWKIHPNVNQQALTAELNRILALATPEPEDEAKKEAILQIMARLKFEYEDLMNFFRRPNSNFGETWMEINRRRDEDCEALGNGFWEVVRTYGGQPAEVYHMPAISCRLLANGRGVAQAQRTPPVMGALPGGDPVGHRLRFFKFFGDPWIMDLRTGKIHGVFVAQEEVTDFLKLTEWQNPDTGETAPRFARVALPEEMEPAGFAAMWWLDRDGHPMVLDPLYWASEVIWLKKYSVRQGDGYGVPDIVASMPAVTGTDGAHQYQLDFFDNAAIPALLVHLKGFPAGEGDEEDDPVAATQDHFDNHIRGPGNGSRTLVIGTPPSIQDASGNREGEADVKVEKVAESVSEASFLGYLENNFDEILRVERTPIEMIASVKNVARPSANGMSTGIEVFKSFVIRPEQELREEAINRLIQDGFNYDWTFHFAEIDTLDELREMEVAQGYYNIHCLTVNEIRAKMGREPLPGGDRAFIVTPTGTLFLDEMEQMTTSETASVPSNPLNPADAGKQTGRGKTPLPAIGPTERGTPAKNKVQGEELILTNAYGLDPRAQWFLAQEFGWMDRKRKI